MARKKITKTKKPLSYWIVGANATNMWVSGHQVQGWMNRRGHAKARSAKDADVLLFVGGADISPTIYHQPRHLMTFANAPRRDELEINMARMGRNKLKVGICRGAQLLNALSGGSMIQHIGNGAHKQRHAVRLTNSSRTFTKVPSTHHQIMVPSRDTAARKVLATAWDPKKQLRTLSSAFDKQLPMEMDKQFDNWVDKYTTPDFNPMNDDAEVVWYRNTFSLCIQGHPERTLGSNYQKYCMNLIENHAALMPDYLECDRLTAERRAKLDNNA